MTRRAKKIIGYCGTGLLLAIGTAVVCIAGKADSGNVSRHHTMISADPIRLGGGWGYEIKVNHKLLIYQNQVPCFPGKRVFPSRECALAAARIVEEKIVQGESPSLSREDIEKILSHQERR